MNPLTTLAIIGKIIIFSQIFYHDIEILNFNISFDGLEQEESISVLFITID